MMIRDCLLGIAILFLMATPCLADKNLVVMAGARQEGIKEFFYRFVRDFETKESKSESFHGWRRPILRDEDLNLLRQEKSVGTNISRYNAFDLLFRRKSDGIVQEVLMDAIRRSWKNSTNGIILGEEKFGTADALKTIYRLMENLSIRTEDVTLVLIYDTPRVEQWASVWRENSLYNEYSDFLCKNNEAETRFEHLDTTMNPFKIASVYRQHGFNVVVLDEEGTKLSGLDPAHAIACNVLGVSCKEGWISGLKGEISRPLRSYEINGLDDDDKRNLEELFLLRDCTYKDELEFQNRDRGFKIINEESIWENCRKSNNFEWSQKITDVDYFLNIIQSQKGCERESVDLSEFLLPSTNLSARKHLWSMIFVSVLFIAAVLGIFFILKKHGKKIKDEFDGLFREGIFEKGQSTNSMPRNERDCSKYLCNACRFVRVDPNCIFCQDRRRLTSSEIGKEVERRIKQQQRATQVVVGNEADDDNDTSFRLSYSSSNAPIESSNAADLHNIWPSKSSVSKGLNGVNSIDTSHFDMNLRQTRSQSKKKRKKKIEQKSKVVRKLKELLVLKNESGEKVYKLTEPSGISPTDNLQTITFEKDDTVYA